jgi:hypothetical protein
VDSSPTQLWRRPSEDCSGACHLQQKRLAKVLAIGQIARHYKSGSVVVESGTVSAERDIEDLADQSATKPDMNQRWAFMQGSASRHMAANSIEYPHDIVDVLPDWILGPPVLDPIESRSGILKHRVEGLLPGRLAPLHVVAQCK